MTDSSIKCQTHTKIIDASRATVSSHARIPEKIVARRLTSFIEPLLPTALGGYSPGRETWINAALFAAETWEGFEAKEDTLAVALDLEDAYN